MENCNIILEGYKKMGVSFNDDNVIDTKITSKIAKLNTEIEELKKTVHKYEARNMELFHYEEQKCKARHHSKRWRNRIPINLKS